MQIYYALFDQATDMGGGNYWTWADEGLPHELLTRFYNEFAAKHLAPEPNKLGNEFWGGIVHFAAKSLENCGWLVLYREFDGGHDRQNRPNRFVILTAWIRTDEVYENLVSVFNNETFLYISAHSKELPVPSPTVPSPAVPLKNSNENPMRSAFEKFVPYINPYWDSHLQIENKPSGMDTTESDAFVQELNVRFKTERLEKKRIKDELTGKLQLANELMSAKEKEWENKKEKLNVTIQEKIEIIKSKNAEIENLAKLTTESRWQPFLCGVIVVVLLLSVTVLILLLTGDMKFDNGILGNSLKSIMSALTNWSK